ncbi:hypothetical protein RRG08_040428 [Elysia crispata]|uniref:C-factor n=1 Tax=Elysia crispata TaxID=231223 RepID=A0AAE1DEG5_9GAST|nr:hypothetical protein RRG08_040428 [Elysia crispata]
MFSGRTVMVSGASRGIGLEFVKQILALPFAPEVLIAACRDPISATDLQKMAKSNPSLKIIKLDLESDADIENAFNVTQTLLGKKGLNILINNGAYFDQSDAGELRHVTRESLQKHFNINVSGHILVVQRFLPLLKLAVAERGSKQLNCQAQVVMISSIQSSQTITNQGGLRICIHYKCSKTAVTMASILMSQELQHAGIHVLPLHPGYVRTEMGGPKASLSVEESVSGCLKVIGSSSAATTGKLLDYSGEQLPY